MMMRLERMCVLVMAGAMMAAGASAQSGAADGAAGVALWACRNPFYAASTLPFQAPPFNKIKDSDYQPAIEAGIAQQLQEMDAIANNPAAPTFDNTIVAMEKTGQLLNRVTLVFFGVTQANTNDTLQKVQDIETPKLAALQDAIYLNNKLFARVQKIYDARAALKLDAGVAAAGGGGLSRVCEGWGEAERCGQDEAEEVERRRGGAVEYVYEQAAGGDEGCGLQHDGQDKAGGVERCAGAGGADCGEGARERPDM